MSTEYELLDEGGFRIAECRPLEHIKALYALHVYEGPGDRNISQCARLLRLSRSTTRRLVDLGLEIRGPALVDVPRSICPSCGYRYVGKHIEADCPNCPGQCLEHDTELAPAAVAALIAASEEEDRCQDTPTPSE